jgi:hypothetical protein
VVNLNQGLTRPAVFLMAEAGTDGNTIQGGGSVSDNQVTSGLSSGDSSVNKIVQKTPTPNHPGKNSSIDIFHSTSHRLWMRQ